MQERRPIVIPQAHVPIIHPCLFFDDGSGTFNYVASGDGADYDAEYSTTYAFTGAKGIKLATRTTGPQAGDDVTIHKDLHVPPQKLVRLRFLHMQPSINPDALLYAMIYWYDGTNLNAAEIMFKTSDQKVYYAATFHADYTATGLVFSEVSNVWNYVDLSINLNTGYYTSLRVNNLIADLSAVAFATSASANNSHLRLYFKVEAVGADKTYAAIDQVILTAENP